MGGEEERGVAAGVGTRSVVYCVIPSELASKLHDLLRRHFADDPGVEVVVERRHRERRGGVERRQADGDAPAEGERRQIRADTGRRVGERRASLAPVSPPPLPRRARRYEDQVAFVERLEPPTEDAEDLDTARVVMRFQHGDREAFGILYTRYFDRVYGYFRVALSDRHEAEDAAQEVFAKVLEKLPEYERRRQPFRAWLFVVARNHAVRHLRKQGRTVLVDPAELDRRREGVAAEEPGLSSLDWINDRELLMLVERLPDGQRQVLAMRFMLGLTLKEAAELLGRTPNDIAQMQHRATGFLRERLTALGRAPEQRGGASMRAWLKPAQVLRRRRSALL